MLTSRRVRMEHSASGVFVDAASQLAVDRDFEVTQFEVTESDAALEIRTEHLRPFLRQEGVHAVRSVGHDALP